ncbi:hypothetical protein FHS27_001933 [Rhodopirellula rubra]|uniref:Uncharacterized protein n=1 Tax=Aporhodopirellula rubra TaxID=980271 RepID=A0A7W5H5P6_9BACT|nr:hypothetical protein [Aporhodopirellula rubra]
MNWMPGKNQRSLVQAKVKRTWDASIKLTLC